MQALKTSWIILKRTGQGCADDRILTHAAALAFYTALSLPPLLVLVVQALGQVTPGVESHLEAEAGALIGAEGKELVDAILENSRRGETLRRFSGLLGIATLLFAASGVFSQLQISLNHVWRVEPLPKAFLKEWLRKRFLSFGLVGVVAFLMAVSLAASTFLGAIDVGGRDSLLRQFLHQGLSIALFTLLFAAVFRLLPDVVMSWRDVFGGSLITALLFTAGKWAIGLYLAQRGLAEAYGAAGSAVVVLAWVYFSGAILLVGAEIIRAWLGTSGRRIAPNAHARAIEVAEAEGQERGSRAGDAPDRSSPRLESR